MKGCYSYVGNLWRRFSNFLLGIRSFTEKATVGSLRDYDLLIYGSLLKHFCLMTILFLKATKVGYPRGVYVQVCYVQLFLSFC